MQALLNHGRFLFDMKPVRGTFGLVLHWTVEDFDSEVDDIVVAKGNALSFAAAWYEAVTAVGAILRDEKAREVTP